MSDFDEQQQTQEEEYVLESGGGDNLPQEPSAPPPPSLDIAASAGSSASSDQQCGSSGDGSGSRMLLCCSYLQRTDPSVKSLLLWSDPKRSAAVLFSSLTLLWSCMSQSFVSVIAYLGLAALLCTCAVRLYAYTMKRGGGGTVGEESHDLLACLQEPVRLPRRCVLDFVERRLECLERDVNTLLDLLLFRDSVRTLKFFCCLIILTYVGSWFNALTLVSLAIVTAFCLPKAYSVYYQQVDAALGQALDHYRHVNSKIRAAIPFGKEKKN